MKLSPAASWRRRTWPGPGSPTSTSSHLRASGPPTSWTRIACGIALSNEKPRLTRGEAGLKCKAGRRSDGGVCRQRREQKQCDDVGDLDHRIDGRAGSILVGIAHRVAGDRGLVRLGAFAAVIAVLDILL